MAKKTKEKTIKFTSEKFKEMKHMDKNQMEDYLNEVYQHGYQRGQMAAGSAFDLELAMESISKIKGVGTVKIELIRMALMAAGAK